jgi:HEAT repeat protein
MTTRRVVWLLAAVIVLAGAAVLVPASPYYLPKWLASPRHYGGQPVRHWLNNLDSPDKEVRTEAIFSLGMIGAHAPEAVPRLAVILIEDPSHEARIEAALALSKMDPVSRGAVAELGQALTDKHYLVRMNAARALFRLKAEAHPAIPQLIKAYEDKSNQTNIGIFPHTIQELVILTLGSAGAGTTDTVPTLLAALEGADTDGLRRVSATALGHVGPQARTAVPQLKKLLDDKDEDVRLAAEEALARITGEAPVKKKS